MPLYIPFGIDSCLRCLLLVFPSGKYVLYFGPEFRNAHIIGNTNIKKYLDASNGDNCFLAVNEIPIEAKNIMENLINVFFSFFHISRHEWNISMVRYFIIES